MNEINEERMRHARAATMAAGSAAVEGVSLVPRYLLSSLVTSIVCVLLPSIVVAIVVGIAFVGSCLVLGGYKSKYQRNLQEYTEIHNKY